MKLMKVREIWPWPRTIKKIYWILSKVSPCMLTYQSFRPSDLFPHLRDLLIEMSDCSRCSPCWWRTLGVPDNFQGRNTITLRTPLIIREWIDTNMRKICIYWTISQVVFVDTLQMLTHRSSSSSFTGTVSVDRLLLQTHRILPSASIQTHTLLPSPWPLWQSSEFEQLHVVHWQFLDQERLTRSVASVWRQSCLFFVHNKPFPSLPFPRLRCLLLLKKMKRHTFTNYFINFISRPKWN
jgi:hypothetical protein